jgi:outer membrane immunogenic protein
MKKTVLSAFVVGALLSGPAMAADLPARMVTKAPPLPVLYNWTGFYIGGNAGYAWGSSDVTTSTIFDPAGYFAATSVPGVNAAGIGSIDPRGFTGGGQIGYNWQTGTLVFGLEADFEFFRQDDTRSITSPYPAPFGASNFTLHQNVKTDWLFTLRPRAGIAANNWLFYVTGGLAVTELKTSFTFADTFGPSSASGAASDTKAGWTVGGGIEYGLTPNWTIRAEYLFVHFDDVTLTSTNLRNNGAGVSFPQNVFTHSADLQSNIVRGAINYKF